MDQGDRGPTARAGSDLDGRRRRNVSGLLQGIIAAMFVLPIARLVMGPIPGLSFHHIGLLFGMTVLGGLTFSALGLFLGTGIPPQQIGLMFSVILAPMIFFGCNYYPWRGLDVVPAREVGGTDQPAGLRLRGIAGGTDSRHSTHADGSHRGGAGFPDLLLYVFLGLRAFRKRAVL